MSSAGNEKDSFWTDAWNMTKKAGKLTLDTLGLAVAVVVGVGLTAVGYGLDLLVNFGPASFLVIGGAILAAVGAVCADDPTPGLKMMGSGATMMPWIGGGLSTLGDTFGAKSKEVVAGIKENVEKDIKAIAKIPEDKTIVQSIKDFFQKSAEEAPRNA